MAETPRFLAVLDIDDVQADTARTLVNYSNQMWNTTLRVVDFRDNFRQMWGVDRAEATRRWFDFCSQWLPRLEPIEDSVRVVGDLPEHVALQSLTSRRATQEGVTVAWENRHFPRISSVHFATINWDGDPKAHLRTKSSDLQDLRTEVDIFVDNEPKHVLGSAAVVNMGVLFDAHGLYSDIELPSNVVRITNWPTLGEFVEEQAEEKLRQAA